MTPTVSGTVVDRGGNTASWSASWTVGGLPGRVDGKVLVGMSTDNFSTRMAELGRPIGADHFFVDSWDPAEFVRKANEANGRGLFPYGNMKTGAWGPYGTGARDAQVDAFAQQLAQLGYPVRVTLHHEPGFDLKGSDAFDGEAGTAQEWVAMGARCYPRIKAIAPNAVTGGVINGFIMSAKTNQQGVDFATLNSVFTDAYLDAIDAFGGDYYDGATSPTNGEPAWVKVERCDQWLTSRGYDGFADVGEFNFVKPADCDAMTSLLTERAGRWWCALNFNSDNNNRASIPTIGGGWNLSHGFATQWDRRDAFRRMLDHPLTHP